MTTRDVRDMLGLSADGDSAQPKPKRPKKGPKSHKPPNGVSRELFALMGERAPPIPIQKPQHHYRKAPKKRTHNIKWKWTTFHNQARTDGLELGHWTKVSIPIRPTVDSGDDVQMEGQPEILEQTDSAEASSQPYRFAKFNMQAEAPSYTDEEYASHLKSENWTKEETDYLMDSYRTFYGKWPVIHDRYEWMPESSDVVQSASRSLEELKARYYDVSQKIMVIRTPQSNMTQTEFSVWEMMKNFDPRHEIQRKAGIDRLLRQNAAEKREQDFLVSELKRIFERQEESAQKLKDLRERLDHSGTDDKTNTGTFTTSNEITALYQRLVTSSRSQQTVKRRSLVEVNPSPSGTPSNAAGNSQPKRGSTAADGGAVRRTLSPRTEARFGVSSHDKLSSGVYFKSEKINKFRTAKSQIQTQKIADILVQVGIPDVVQMPTSSVCDAMESLVARVHMLLDARKIYEKENNEIAVAEQQKQMALNGKTGESAAKADGTVSENENKTGVSGVSTDGKAQADAAAAEDDDAADDDDADAEAAEEEDAEEEEEEANEDEEEEEEEDEGEDDEDEAEVEADADAEVEVDDEEAREDVDEDDDGEEEEGEEEDDAEEEDEEEDDAEEEPESVAASPAPTKAHKRSASDLSEGSAASSSRPGSKRQKSTRG